jgi:hypothetical protein
VSWNAIAYNHPVNLPLNWRTTDFRNGTNYSLRIIAHDSSIARYYYDVVDHPFILNNTVDVRNYNEVVTSYELFANYPNPFNPTTTIRYQLPQAGKASLKIFDILGREVQTLVDEVQISGSYSVNFNASSLASGVYFYRLQSGNFVSTKKMLMVK